MLSPQPAQEPEALLQQWLEESDERRACELLATLMRHHAEPLMRRIVGFKLEPAGGAGDRGSRRADIDDVCSTALYNLLARLNRVKGGDPAPPVRNFKGYAAVVAYNACNEYFRAKKPEWARLSMKLRYLATHDPKFSLWLDAEGQDVCGLARDCGTNPSRDAGHLAEVCMGLWRSRDPARLNLPELVESVLEAAKAPLILEDLVDVVAECWGLKDAWVASLAQERWEGAPLRELEDNRPAAEARMREQQYLARLWKEIRELPVEHRRALLLNLEDSAGGDIQLFDCLGIATVREIAVALEMDPVEFADLWKSLPLDDAAIGRRFGLSRQDIANRRSSARKRLARRMREFELGN
jgi:hypothetical protein